ncbi:hypothetical protein Ahy_Scaffold1g107277 isoform D [Arachis hypogaea]|uniref:Uncharacterized protein n=1 Tax=Arachis hypogaea TaxID=3818 RepID=A0A444WVA7_ARAHY|nr:hypothetical protein Ahy_Scaffold1g107277 isoform D [Arachis hypogaea]
MRDAESSLVALRFLPFFPSIISFAFDTVDMLLRHTPPFSAAAATAAEEIRNPTRIRFILQLLLRLHHRPYSPKLLNWVWI